MKVTFGILIAIALFVGGFLAGQKLLRQQAALAVAVAEAETIEARLDLEVAQAEVVAASTEADSAMALAQVAVARANAVVTPSRPPQPDTVPEGPPQWQLDALQVAVGRWIAYSDSLEIQLAAEQSARSALEKQVAALIYQADALFGEVEMHARINATLQATIQQQAIALAPPSLWRRVGEKALPAVGGAILGALVQRLLIPKS